QYEEDINHTLFLLLLTLFTETNFGSDIGQNEKVNEQVYRAKRNLDDYLSNVTFEDLDVYDFDLQLPSQFYIEKMRESAQERFTKLEPNKSKPTQNFKKILFDQYSIGDAVYNYFFEVNQDQDVFDHLITEKHPVLKYQKANEKYQIVKAAREVKERMLDEQTKLEQTWIEKIAELKNEAIKYLEETIRKEHDQILMDEEERMLEELKVLEYKLNKEIQIKIQEKKKSLSVKLQETRKDYQTKTTAYKKQETERLEAAKAKLKASFEERQKKLKEQMKKKETQKLKEITVENESKLNAVKQEFSKTQKEIKEKNKKALAQYQEKLDKKPTTRKKKSE